MNNVQYSFVTANGNFCFRSTVNSHGLDHVTDKDLSSFYTTFSSYSYQDTGLLPVNGSGLLSLRSAGKHTQIAYQHSPGMYYINWGAYEGDRSALKYHVAQPYRIVIADLLNDNLLGARTFYSPSPITHPNQPLYHVNLPNINCRGYRGNGVGWICLYHTDDISTYPFNEKLIKILDRCSGTEAYNDANMSETDGPRFYRDHEKPIHLHDPQRWEEYSQSNGYEWTLDPDLWIPILVKDKDNQDKHYDAGQPLTFVDAIIGNYQAYYTDNLIPKPVNLITRSDYNLDFQTVFDWFKHAYNISSISSPTSNPFSAALEVRENIFSTIFSSNESEPESNDSWFCEDCNETFEGAETANTTYSSPWICDDCIDNYVHCVNTTSMHHQEDEVLYLDKSALWIYLGTATPDTFKYCSVCDSGYYYTHKSFSTHIVHEHGCSTCSDTSSISHENSSSEDNSPF